MDTLPARNRIFEQLIADYAEEKRQRCQMEKKYARLKKKYDKLERMHAKILQESNIFNGVDPSNQENSHSSASEDENSSRLRSIATPSSISSIVELRHSFSTNNPTRQQNSTTRDYIRARSTSTRNQQSRARYNISDFCPESPPSPNGSTTSSSHSSVFHSRLLSRSPTPTTSPVPTSFNFIRTQNISSATMTNTSASDAPRSVPSISTTRRASRSSSLNNQQESESLNADMLSPLESTRRFIQSQQRRMSNSWRELRTPNQNNSGTQSSNSSSNAINTSVPVNNQLGVDIDVMNGWRELRNNANRQSNTSMSRLNSRRLSNSSLNFRNSSSAPSTHHDQSISVTSGHDSESELASRTLAEYLQRMEHLTALEDIDEDSFYTRMNQRLASNTILQMPQLDVDNMSYEELLALTERNGDVKRDRWRELSEEILQNLPTRTWNQSDMNGESKMCIICQHDFNRKDCILTLPCTHIFHNDCVGDWVRNNNSCPLCTQEILAM